MRLKNELSEEFLSMSMKLQILGHFAPRSNSKLLKSSNYQNYLIGALGIVKDKPIGKGVNFAQRYRNFHLRRSFWTS